MRIHIENVQDKVELLEKEKDKHNKEFQEQMVEVKREKRRLDDLLTIREEELKKMRDGDKLRTKIQLEKESLVQEYEKKIKHLEKRYEKQLTKMTVELARYKKIVDENEHSTQNTCETT
jgi:hypothetical protein